MSLLLLWPLMGWVGATIYLRDCMDDWFTYVLIVINGAIAGPVIFVMGLWSLYDPRR